MFASALLLKVSSAIKIESGINVYAYRLLPQHKVEGLLNSALEHDSSSLLDFLFQDPLGETTVIVVIIVGPSLQTKVVGDRFPKTDFSYTKIFLVLKLLLNFLDVFPETDFRYTTITSARNIF